ncbi:MAG: hypothetical protein ACFFEF_15110 [Candidatus Thorarchaeota archaeon]
MGRVVDLKKEINEPSRSFVRRPEKHQRQCVMWHSPNRISARGEELIIDGGIL